VARGDPATKEITICDGLRQRTGKRIFIVNRSLSVSDTFYIKAKWDEEAKVYYSETNVPGLNIEAETLKSFLELAEDLAPQMLRANLPDNARPVTVSGLELAIAC
jgi:hypothetical protein